ncbi:hypothetical protein TeGR_g14073 [Tetraparma gracilis]|uniref:MYND-type domain-containing protein n=1 Tax=Tetraparma gracilis TaxID=2962635 RepID=A0ABQ6M6A2_9STRA|nr:hypothetical protein TeGR_g14073 [Tetraparma gracilis]
MGYLDIVTILVENGAEIDMQDDWGFTPLSGASQNGHLEIVKFLVEKGADPHKINLDNQTPLFRASINKHLHVVKYLTKVAGSDPNNAGMTKASTVARLNGGSAELVDYLKKKEQNACNVCGKGGAKKCPCELVMYCGKVCQLQDYKAHKASCREARAAKGA